MKAPTPLLTVWALLAAAATAALEVPFLAGRVNDLAGLLQEETRERLEQKLAQLEADTGSQVVVLTIPSLEGESLEEYAHRVASTWQLGQRGQDNGVLFLIAKNDRKMRLEVGYGLESVLPDAACRRILDNVVRPRFRSGDFDGGIEAGVDAVATAIRSGALPVEAQRPSESSGRGPGLFALVIFLGIFTVVVGLFSLLALLSTGFASWFLYLFLLPFWTIFPMAVAPQVGLVTGLGWLVGFPILKFLLDRTPWGQAFRQAHPGLVDLATSRSRGGYWSGGGFSGGFSGGGFSGGGGSFGGGGASSSW